MGREFGIRLALGARPTDLLRGVVARDARVIMGGVVLGLALAAALSRGVAGFLFGVTPYDPVAYAVAGIGLAFVGLVASYLPARRTSTLQPVEVLREE